MTNKLLEDVPAKRDQGSEQEAGLLEAVVRDNVLAALGRPAGNHHHVQVRRVWGDNYRVNVFVGADVTSLVIAHSYFLRADGDGKILTCSPAIVRAI
jgi:hypothetical protein